jgi:deaminated glutathione amidase
MKPRVATCQFPIGSDVRKNLEYVARQIRTASDRGADVAHFPEACLSGYAGVDFASHKGFDWSLLEECAREVFDLARESRIGVVLGSAHRPRRPGTWPTTARASTSASSPLKASGAAP